MKHIGMNDEYVVGYLCKNTSIKNLMICRNDFMYKFIVRLMKYNQTNMRIWS